MSMSREALLTEKLFKKYKLKIKEFSYRGYISDDQKFPGEVGSLEVRISLGEIRDKEWLKDWYGYDSLKTYNSNLDNYSQDKNSLEDFKEDLKKVENEIPFIVDEQLEFSIFKRIENTNLNIKNDIIISLAYESAFYYMNFLVGTMPQTYNKSLEYLSSYTEYIDEFKEVLEQSGVSINNTNIELIQSLSYRLYKDSKFFYELKEHLGKGTYESFIEDFEYIINNPDVGIDILEKNVWN